MGLLWLTTMIIAYGWGYGSGHHTSSTFAEIWTSSIVGAFIGGMVLVTNNRHRRD